LNKSLEAQLGSSRFRLQVRVARLIGDEAGGSDPVRASTLVTVCVAAVRSATLRGLRLNAVAL
jgi:hypothetical protein